MPLFMDVHEIDGSVAMQDVAQAHLADLQTQAAYDVRYLRYWVDESTGRVFCLVEAPSAEAAAGVHREAHGLVADHVYRPNQWQLGALEWVFTTPPKTPPLPNATFGFFPAACHYTDGTFVVAKNPATCPKKAPHTGATFNFWHPDLTTMHVWVWYPNPAGLYSSTNPLVAPFNGN